jgi:hypothetical protein
MSTTDPTTGFVFKDASDTIAPIHTYVNDLINPINDYAKVRRAKSYEWANLTDQNAQTGMTVGATGYRTDTNSRYRYDGSAWKLWSVPKVSYTPTFAAGFALGNGTLTSWYQVIEGRVFFYVEIIAGSTTTWTSGNINPTVPVGTISGTTTDAIQPIGNVSYLDTSASGRWYGYLGNILSNTAVQPRGIGSNSTGSSSWVGSATAGSNVPSGAVIATGDILAFNGSYIPA